jgi:[acyl-carrier-protein] S-malonyltransferase
MTTAVIFTGQGAQRPGMADPWLEHPVAAAVLAEATEALGYDVAHACSDAAALEKTEVAQAALFACGIAAYRVLAEYGISPSVVAGHSLGEFTALVAAGVLGLGEALEVVRVRAAAMGEAAAAQEGAMTAILGAGAGDLAARVVGRVLAGSSEEILVVANDNGPRQVVLSGTVTAVARAEDLVRAAGGRVTRLKVAGAFHSPLMAPATAAVNEVLDRLTWRPPGPLVIPNVTGMPTDDPELIATLARRHLLAPVRWADTVRALDSMGVTEVVECGPAPVLTGLSKQQLAGVDFHHVATPASARAAADSALPVG